MGTASTIPRRTTDEVRGLEVGTGGGPETKDVTGVVTVS
jgi:hypothetical protein